MGSLDKCLHWDANWMGDTAKISPSVPSTCAENAILCLLSIRDCKVMGDSAKISPHVPSTWAQNAILCLLIIHIIPCHQSYVANDNQSLVPSVYCLATCRYVWNDVHAANNISHAETLHSNRYLWFSHLYKLRYGIQGTGVFMYCGEHQGERVHNESSILV